MVGSLQLDAAHLFNQLVKGSNHFGLYNEDLLAVLKERVLVIFWSLLKEEEGWWDERQGQADSALHY